MTVRKPHFLLYCDASLSAARNASEANVARCKWRCVVDGLNEQTRMEIADSESDSSPDRSALVAVVRGLEALEQPSQVTLITSSPYVNKGMRYGLKEWRESDYKWEHFGTEKPIRNADLWRRLIKPCNSMQSNAGLSKAQTRCSKPSRFILSIKIESFASIVHMMCIRSMRSTLKHNNPREDY